jgi:hypothetical protein
MGCVNVGTEELVEDRVQRPAFVNTVLNLHVVWKSLIY